MIYVDHEDDPGTGGSRFDVILSYNELREGTQPLYIEIKERNTSEAFIENLLRDLMRFGYGVEGRPVFLRAFYGRRESLLIARRLLGTGGVFLHFDPIFASMLSFLKITQTVLPLRIPVFVNCIIWACMG